MSDKVGDKKWSDIKDADFSTRWAFWNDKYMTWDCEEDKMKAMVCYYPASFGMEKKYL